MLGLRLLRARLCWAMVISLVLSGLTPALAQTNAGDEGSQWAQVCTAHGTAWVSVGSDDGQAETANGPSVCPLCSHLHLDRAPPPEWALATLQRHTQERPVGRPDIPLHTRAPWQRVGARAPPVCG